MVNVSTIDVPSVSGPETSPRPGLFGCKAGSVLPLFGYKLLGCEEEEEEYFTFVWLQNP